MKKTTKNKREVKTKAKPARREWWIAIYADGSGSAYHKKSDAIEAFRQSVEPMHDIIKAREIRR